MVYYFIDRVRVTLVHIGNLSEHGLELRRQEEYGIVRNSDWIQFLFGKQDIQVGDVPRYTIVEDMDRYIHDLVTSNPEPSADAVSDGFIRLYLHCRSSEQVNTNLTYTHSKEEGTLYQMSEEKSKDGDLVFCTDSAAKSDHHILSIMDDLVDERLTKHKQQSLTKMNSEHQRKKIEEYFKTGRRWSISWTWAELAK